MERDEVFKGLVVIRLRDHLLSSVSLQSPLHLVLVLVICFHFAFRIKETQFKPVKHT